MSPRRQADTLEAGCKLKLPIESTHTLPITSFAVIVAQGIAVWLAKKRDKDNAFLATNICIFVSQ
jgi:hypothetical protein